MKSDKKILRDDFAILILTHGRAERMHTLKTLEKNNYTGKWYLIIDNQDDDAENYYRIYGRDKVIMFDKDEAYQRTDTADTFGEMRAIVFARNESYRIAKELGLTYFMMIDDDYKRIDYRFAEDGLLKSRGVKQMDRLIAGMIEFMEASNALTVAFCQGGDFIGGLQGKTWGKKVIRKAMNTFLCRVDKPISFVGTMNDDVTFYADAGRKGELVLSITDIGIVPEITQKGAGGTSEVYIDSGTYLKSFYSVMVCPSAVKVGMMGSTNMRIHHHVAWNHCASLILNEKYRKVRGEVDDEKAEQDSEEHYF